ncbi:ATP-binding protein [Desulfobacterales bacterium HSG16]|nr:ATP-binding protein [Desulfobacterales bacterium HSG16]
MKPLQFFGHELFGRSLKFKMAVVSGCLILGVVSMLTIASAFNATIFLKKELKQEVAGNVRHGIEMFHRFQEEIETKLSLWCSQPVLNVFLNNPAMASVSRSGLMAYFSKIRAVESWITEILIIDQGEILYADSALFNPASPELEQLTGKLSQGAVFTAINLNAFKPDTDKPLLVISRPFDKSGKLKGHKTIAIVLDLEQVNDKLFKSYTIGQGGFLTLAALSSKGDLIIPRSRAKKIIQGSEGWESSADISQHNKQMVIKQEIVPDTPVIVIGVASLNDIHGTIRHMSLITVMFGVFACIAGISGVFMLSRYITGPLDLLTDKVVSFASDILEKPESGTISRMQRSRDEIEILTEAFEILFSKIQGYTESLEEQVEKRTLELKDANLRMEKEIEERMQGKKELIRAKETAEAANQAKSEFMARMSHELRTPMNAIIGMAHLCLETELTPEQKDYLAKIHRSGRSLFAVISDILDFSRIESGKIEITNEAFPLNQLISKIAVRMDMIAKGKGLEMTITADPDLPPVIKGDFKRLRQILIHLVGNAVKFTETGEITVSVKPFLETCDQVTLKFSVQDTGIGMTAGQMAGLFQPFAQADGSATRQYGGSGLGLTICKHLAELMKGEIGAESDPGKGSTLFFTACFDKTEAGLMSEKEPGSEKDAGPGKYPDIPERVMISPGSDDCKNQNSELLDNIDINEASSLLKTLLELLEDDDMEAVEFLNHVNGQLKNTAIREYLKMIDGHVRRYAFENALAVLARLAEKLNITID